VSGRRHEWEIINPPADELSDQRIRPSDHDWRCLSCGVTVGRDLGTRDFERVMGRRCDETAERLAHVGGVLELHDHRFEVAAHRDCDRRFTPWKFVYSCRGCGLDGPAMFDTVEHAVERLLSKYFPDPSCEGVRLQLLAEQVMQS